MPYPECLPGRDYRVGINALTHKVGFIYPERLSGRRIEEWVRNRGSSRPHSLQGTQGRTGRDHGVVINT